MPALTVVLIDVSSHGKLLDTYTLEELHRSASTECEPRAPCLALQRVAIFALVQTEPDIEAPRINVD